MAELGAGSLWRRLIHGVCRLRYRADWPLFAGADFADWIMTAPTIDDFHQKQGRSTGRCVFAAASGKRSVYLKRHYRLPWWRGILALLWPKGSWSPAWREWDNLQWAASRGVPVPKPMAVGEYIGPRFRLRSFLVIEELEGMLPLHHAIPLAREQLPPAAFRRWKHGVVGEIARLVRTLHEARRFHKDLYLCHFFVRESDIRDIGNDEEDYWKGRLYLIDFHRLGFHPWTGWRWRIKDLAQLLYSSELPGIEEHDRIRFFRTYMGQRRRAGSGPWLMRLVLWKAGAYRRHNAKSRSQNSEAGSPVTV